MRLKRIIALSLAAMMCAPCAGAELKKGDRGGSVLKVQDELYARGYLAEEGDGQYGQQTAAAVQSFQQDHALEPTGIVNDQTYELLINGEDAKLRKAAEKLKALGWIPAGAEEISDAAIVLFRQMNALEAGEGLDEDVMQLLESGSAASAYKLAQEVLIRLGYLQGTADGKFGEQSKSALMLFQSANGIESTGALDETSMSMLFSGSAVGDPVRMLQQRLIDLGYLDGAADGSFGAKSIAALKTFQQTHDLEPTGEGDDATLAKLFSAEAKEVYPTLNSVSVNTDAIIRLQQKLIDLGFLDGRADGKYGSKTYDAVLAFQQHIAAQGYETRTDGEADSEMQSVLFDGGYSSYLADVNPGDESADALRIERRLSALGYMDAAADKLYDDYAAACMKAFQSASGLEAHGAADKASIDALFSADAAQSEQYVLHDIHMGENSAVVEYAHAALSRMGFLEQYTFKADSAYNAQTEDALERLYTYLALYNGGWAETFAQIGGLSAAAVKILMETELVVFAADIGEGSDSGEIARVQRRLSGLFYDTATDGIWGEGTAAAVSAFQAANALEVTGVADKATQRVLFSESAKGQWTKYLLRVSISDQRVYVYGLDEDGQYRQIDAFICSTGMDTGADDSTPRGIFSKTTEPLDRWHYFIEYECWAQYAWRITGPIYFHSVIFSEKDESTLRMSSVYNLGRKASHGCIRLSVENAKWIYENCDAGTIVYIAN